MKQWDIWTCDFADAGPRPAVIVSHPDRVGRAPLVNVLIGSSQPGFPDAEPRAPAARHAPGQPQPLYRTAPDDVCGVFQPPRPPQRTPDLRAFQGADRRRP